MWTNEGAKIPQDELDMLLMITNIRIWIDSLFKDKKEMKTKDVKPEFRFLKFQKYLVENHQLIYTEMEVRLPGIYALLKEQGKDQNEKDPNFNNEDLQNLKDDADGMGLNDTEELDL